MMNAQKTAEHWLRVASLNAGEPTYIPQTTIVIMARIDGPGYNVMDNGEEVECANLDEATRVVMENLEA